MSTSGPKVDRFATLPNELLEDILHLAHSLDHPLSGPPSKRLLPFFQRAIYREICLQTYRSLERLCLTAEVNPALLALVRRLDITFEMVDPTDSPTEHWKEIDSRLSSLPDESVIYLFQQFVKLEELAISGASRVIQLIIYRKEATGIPLPFLSTLKALDLCSTFDFPFPQRPSLTLQANLHRFTELTQLSLEIRHDGRPRPLDLDAMNLSVQLPSKLEDLSLSGDFAYPEWTHSSLSFPNTLTSLSLNETGDPSLLFVSLQDFVQKPQQITNLQLWLSNDDSDFTRDFDRLQELSEYRNLTSLVVQGPWVPTTPEFYSLLAQLPLLRHVSFKIDTEVSTSELIKLISTSSTSFPSNSTSTSRSLKRLTLDNVDAFRGDSLPRDQGAEAVRDADLIGLNWNLANWTETFSAKGLKELIDVGKREGVIIDGYAVQSLEIEDAWEEEMRYYREVTGNL